MFGSKPAPAPVDPHPWGAWQYGTSMEPIVYAFLALCALHAVCYMLAKQTKGTKLEQLSKDPQLAAHFVPQLVGFGFLACWGATDWLYNMPERDCCHESTLDERWVSGQRVAAVMVALQLYELLACIPSKRLRGNAYEMVGHHVITCSLAYMAYEYGAFNYYAPAFMGMTEVSSLPLAFVDLFKFFPTLRTVFPITNELVRTAFALSFLAIRGVYWPYISYCFWGTTLGSWATATLPAGQIYAFLFSNVALTLLQWFWASLILKALYQKISGDDKHKDA